MKLLRKFLAVACFAFLGAISAAPVFAAPVGDQDGQHHITQLINEALHSFNGSMTRAQKADTLKALIDKYGDVSVSAKDVLGRYWEKATPEQQQTLTGLLLDYTIGSWVDQFGDMPAEERIEFIATQPVGDDRTLFRSLAVSPTGKTPVDWTLTRTAQGRIAIVDVVVEGVSIIQAMGSDFRAIIRSHGGQIDPLIEALKAKIAAYQAAHQ